MMRSPGGVTGENRNKVWLGMVGVLSLVAIAAFAWFARQGLEGPQDPELGQQVQPFELPDVVSGHAVSLGPYLGKQDVVIVSYMGFF